MKDTKKTHISPRLLLTGLGILGSFAIFLFILFVAYLPNRSQSIDEGVVSERRTRLAELQAREKELTTAYGWIDPGKGVVRIPVKRAKELILQEGISVDDARLKVLQNEQD